MRNAIRGNTLVMLPEATLSLLISFLSLTYFTPEMYHNSSEMSAFQDVAYAWSTVLWFLTTISQIVDRR